MEEGKHYRHELKYEIPYADYQAMRRRLSYVMHIDPHATANGKYLIRSIYFDNADDKALREKTDGVAKREKFRIRYYNDDYSFITLEKKMNYQRLRPRVLVSYVREPYIYLPSNVLSRTFSYLRRIY